MSKFTSRSIYLLSIAIFISIVISPAISAGENQELMPGDAPFRFSNWEGPALDVRTFVPDSVTPDTPIVFVIHGWSRDIDRYYNDWRKQGLEHGFIVVVPHFDKKSFPGSNEFNLGHVFYGKSGRRRPERKWTYSVIELLFDEVVKRLSGKQTQYTLYGHSAGAQFVHRFMFFKPDARVKRFIAANAGWYMMPNLTVNYPYGLKKSGLGKKGLNSAFKKHLMVLLGKEDTNPNDPDLRRSPEAMAQGVHRLQRGLSFLKYAAAQAQQQGEDIRWQLALVDGAGHNNAAMAGVAAQLVE